MKISNSVYSNASGCNPIPTPLFSRENGEEDNNKSLLHAEEMMGKCLWMRKSQWFSAENKTVSMHPTHTVVKVEFLFKKSFLQN